MAMMGMQRALPGITRGGSDLLDATELARMKGYVPTPPALVDAMVEKLFRYSVPGPGDAVLDPGCGKAAFVDGVLGWCDRMGVAVPRVLGVEADSRHLHAARKVAEGRPTVELECRDFLVDDIRRFNFVIGNPPYVSITRLSEEEKTEYRRRYDTAVGRFDLYILFFEQALRQLKPGGRLVFVTPEKFLYVSTAGALRRLLCSMSVEEIELVDEEAFPGLVTYPTITTVVNASGGQPTRVVLRDGTVRTVLLPRDGASWLPTILDQHSDGAEGAVTLGDVCLRVSCGVATGADEVFVHLDAAVASELKPFAHPTVSGRELNGSDSPVARRYVMLIPYDQQGRLLPFESLGALGKLLARPAARARLEERTCVRRKPWYAFHENPPMPDILRPKILCKDIGRTPRFWVDERGDTVPRHSVYYIVPRDPAMIRPLVEYLNSTAAREWLAGHCQRAACGFLRLQSSILKRLPLPTGLLGVVPPHRTSSAAEAATANA